MFFSRAPGFSDEVPRSCWNTPKLEHYQEGSVPANMLEMIVYRKLHNFVPTLKAPGGSSLLSDLKKKRFVSGSN